MVPTKHVLSIFWSRECTSSWNLININLDIITFIHTLYFSYNTWKILHFVLKRCLKLLSILKTRSFNIIFFFNIMYMKLSLFVNQIICMRMFNPLFVFLFEFYLSELINLLIVMGRFCPTTKSRVRNSWDVLSYLYPKLLFWVMWLVPTLTIQLHQSCFTIYIEYKTFICVATIRRNPFFCLCQIAFCIYLLISHYFL